MIYLTTRKLVNIISIITLLFSQNLLIAKITKGPYLTKPGKNSMTIMWETDSKKSADFIYWQNKDDLIKINVFPFDNRDSLFLYKITLNDLAVDQKYYYKVITDNDSSESYFYTNPKKGEPFTFVAIGDSRSNHKVFEAIDKDINKLRPRLIINMGDLVHDGKIFEQWGPNFFDPAKSVINHIPHISTLGDHETANGYNGYNFYYYFRNGISVDKQWFSYDFGDVHFISLDYRGINNKEMIEWFKEDVMKSNAKWKIVYSHRPIYNLGGHRSHWGSPLWQKLYREAKIDIVFAGHSHVYERFYPMRPKSEENAWPVTYITTGGAGAELYDAEKNEFVAVSESVHHYNVISISGDTLTLKSFRLDGSILDKFDMVKHDGKYSDSYLKLIKPQEVMDVYMTFANRLSLKFNSLPTKEKSSEASISLNGKELEQDIPFKLQLSKESSKHFRIEPVEGMLKKGKKYRSKVILYAKDKIEQNKKYFSPPLIINLIFDYNGKSFEVFGKESVISLKGK